MRIATARSATTSDGVAPWEKRARPAQVIQNRTGRGAIRPCGETAEEDQAGGRVTPRGRGPTQPPSAVRGSGGRGLWRRATNGRCHGAQDGRGGPRGGQGNGDGVR